jgi:hypothetical protein
MLFVTSDRAFLSISAVMKPATSVIDAMVRLGQGWPYGHADRPTIDGRSQAMASAEAAPVPRHWACAAARRPGPA